jgi:uncharacterized protein (TIGR03435 family)
MTRIISILIVGTSLAWSQSFEVASIRPHVLPRGVFFGDVGLRVSGSRVTAENMTLSNLITYAYGLKPYQVVGQPNWADSIRYDVIAKAEGDAVLTRDLSKRMMQALLADRFQLKYHYGTREMPVYALVVGKNAPKLKESAPDSQGLLTLSGNNTSVLKITKGSMLQLALQLSNNQGVNRPVLDRTGLAGTYDYTLESVPGYGARQDGDAGSIFTAIQEQLGLKLEATKASIEILVIDHAEKPSGN